MSAAVIPFTGEWQGRFEPSDYQRVEESKAGLAEARALHDAKLICAANAQNDDWTARLLLGLLETLNHKQLDLLEFRMLAPEFLTDKSACQALALVQLAKGTNAHRSRVKAALARREAR